ncbi:MAG: porin family protein [Bacteroidota bacterium]|nr:porin family protein [Bacteroidota bacterium]MDP4234002.1 porin family protein [Bacteroidota bacterium]MDP4242869.1 porin family protein [Bacteroidota bacterium]MDP4287693.1 porin family protein [Bacteroidota bacterium]
MQKYFASFLLIVIFASTCSSPVAAQYSSNWFGVRAGINIANESVDILPGGASTGFRIGPSFGAQYDYSLSDSWALSVGLLFNQKGTHQQYDSASLSQTPPTTPIAYGGKDDFTLSYIEIPIVAKATFGYGDFKPYLFAGPSIGILMSASEAVDGTVPPITDVKTFASSTDISLYLGGGLQEQMGSKMVYFDAGYAAGLTKVFKSNPRTASNFIDLSTAKSGDIRLAIGMLWQI